MTGASVCEGSSVTISAGGGVSYLWSPSASLANDTSASTQASPKENTLYQVKVTNQYGCSDTASININKKRAFEKQVE